MRRVLIVIVSFVLAGAAIAQGPTNSGGMGGGNQLWPQYPPVGIGTENGPGGPVNASLQLHYNDTPYTRPAVLRFSQGGGTNTDASGVLALIPNNTVLSFPNWLRLSHFSHGQDLVMRANHGDLILTNNWRGDTTGAIRLGTRPKLELLPPAPVVDTDFERMTVLSNGNVGININPEANGLCKPKDQLQIGGSDTVPGLTIYGGYRFEDMQKPLPAIGRIPIDWRYISFNHWQDHLTREGGRFDSSGASGIWFANGNDGAMQLNSYPWYPSDSLAGMRHGLALELNGKNGLSLWADQRRTGGIEYHHLFDVWRPDSTKAGDSSGMFFHHTPVYIGTAWYNWASTFNGFSSYATQPEIGGTWMLAVDGAALAREFYVSTDWPDYVFEPSYELRPLSEVEAYIAANHHLPDVPSASAMKKSGVPLGTTEAKSMQKIEELTLYIIELNKKMEALESKINELQQGGK